MAKSDPFGLHREHAIQKAGIRKVFTPHLPIEELSLFFGRTDQVKRLIEHINTPGQHGMLYGDRGVGKSSLANVASHLLLKQLITGKFFLKRCDSQDTFETIVGEPLESAKFFDRPISRTTEKNEGGKAGVGLGAVSAGIDTRSVKSQTINLRNIEIQPSTAAGALKSVPGLLLIDEADAISNIADKEKLAEFIKQLSDSRSPFKVLVVGIARTAAELLAGHPSVQRCLKETKLERMSDAEIEQIVTGGAKRLKIKFEPSVVRRIVRISAGYPHFTHLLALKCAETAVAEKHGSIDDSVLQRAMADAVGDAEGTLRTTYDAAARSAGTEMYKTVLFAAAKIDAEEFSAATLREAVAAETGTCIEQGSLNNYLSKLCSDGDETILRRLAKGVYRFNDPRMPSYIKIANGAAASSAKKAG